MNDSLNSSGYPSADVAQGSGCQGIVPVSARGPFTSARTFPRQAPFEPGSPATGGTMHALRLPPEPHRPFVSLQARLIPLAPVGLCLRGCGLPAVVAPPRQAWPLVRPGSAYPGAWTGAQAALPGSRGTPRAFALLSDPAGRARPCPTRTRPAAPPIATGKAHRKQITFEAQSHGCGTRRLRFPPRLLCTGKAGFRLPGRLCRTGFGLRLHPQGSSREFQLSRFRHMATSFRAGLSLARRSRNRTQFPVDDDDDHDYDYGRTHSPSFHWGRQFKPRGSGILTGAVEARHQSLFARWSGGLADRSGG